MLTVKDWDQIRRAFYTDGKSIREIARETGHARRTVTRMVEADEPPKYKRRGPKRAPKLGPYAYSGENDHLFRMIPITQTG